MTFHVLDEPNSEEGRAYLRRLFASPTFAQDAHALLEILDRRQTPAASHWSNLIREELERRENQN